MAIFLAVSVTLTSLGTANKMNPTVFVFLSLALSHLAIMPSGLIHIVACTRIFFLRLNNTLAYVYWYLLNAYLFICRWALGVVSKSRLLWIVLLGAWVCKYSFQDTVFGPFGCISIPLFGECQKLWASHGNGFAFGLLLTAGQSWPATAHPLGLSFSFRYLEAFLLMLWGQS